MTVDPEDVTDPSMPPNPPTTCPMPPHCAQMGDQRTDEPLGSDKSSPPRVAHGAPVPSAGVPQGAAEFLSAGFAGGFAVGADDVTVTCITSEATVTGHAKRTPPPSPAQQQASATARAAGTVRPAAAHALQPSPSSRPAPCE